MLFFSSSFFFLSSEITACSEGVGRHGHPFGIGMFVFSGDMCPISEFHMTAGVGKWFIPSWCSIFWGTVEGLTIIWQGLIESETEWYNGELNDQN